ncbi:MAG TPA: FliH/SctL family protein [Opitutaceae bacterium]|nr:FliH/SctL family protein [Opitutaceae bacterium]
MSFVKLIAFDRPLAAAILPGRETPAHTASEFAAATACAYQRGVDSARAAADQQMVEFRSDMARLGEEVLNGLRDTEAKMLAQIHEALPQLAIDIARRLLGGYEPPPEVVSRLCEEALNQLLPERDGLELILSPRDAELLQNLKPGWLTHFTGLSIRADETLAHGDCLVRSRFGLTDARASTKLATLTQHLTEG